MESLKRSRLAAGLDDAGQPVEHLDSDTSGGTDDRSSQGSRSSTPTPKTGKKTRGRVKINMEFIDNKLRRYTTFSKRKSGIMKKVRMHARPICIGIRTILVLTLFIFNLNTKSVKTNKGACSTFLSHFAIPDSIFYC